MPELRRVAVTGLGIVSPIGNDAEDPESKLLVKGKFNLAKAAPGLRFRIEDPGRVEWSPDAVDVTADEVFTASESSHPDEVGPKIAEAMRFLEELLADGPVRATKVKKEAKENCIAERTLARAKLKLGIRSWNESSIGSAWFWGRPEQMPQ